MSQSANDPATGAPVENGETRRRRSHAMPELLKSSPIAMLWLATMIYAGIVILIFHLSGQDVVQRTQKMLLSVPNSVSNFLAFGAVQSIAVLASVFLLPNLRQRLHIARLRETFLVLVGVNLMFCTFGLLKLSLPQIVPFHADGLLAQVDAALHLGVDPWRLTHAVLGSLPMNNLSWIYIEFWLMPAIFLPVLSTLLDDDKERRAGYLVLWLAVWIVLGSVLAALVMSGGPVYHDRLVPASGERFADLAARLAQADALDLRWIQEMLWQNYTSHDLLAGSGISAFPSVHVGMATVFALYLWEVLPGRRLLAMRVNRVVPVLLLGFYLVMSVHLGWHYAVDGYASILIIGSLGYWLRRGPWTGPRRGI